MPSMSERSPPVTRLITLRISAGPEKVARSPVSREKRSKLWNRLRPARVPRSAPMSKSGPTRSTCGPAVPSVAICAAIDRTPMSQITIAGTAIDQPRQSGGHGNPRRRSTERRPLACSRRVMVAHRRRVGQAKVSGGPCPLQRSRRTALSCQRRRIRWASRVKRAKIRTPVSEIRSTAANMRGMLRR